MGLRDVRNVLMSGMVGMMCLLGLTATGAAQSDGASDEEAEAAAEEAEQGGKTASEKEDGETEAEQGSKQEDGGAEHSDVPEREVPDINPSVELNQANRLAGRNALTRSIRHYKRVIKAAPTDYPSAYFNLASVYEGKREWEDAMFFFQGYAGVSRSAGAKKESEKAVKRIKNYIWHSEERLGTLEVDVEPEAQSKIFVNGFLMARNGDLKGLEVMPDTFEVRVEIVDHHPELKEVEVGKGETKSIEVRPTKKMFYGKARVSVVEEGATVKFIPKKLKNPRGPDDPIVHTSPMKEPVELVTGKWLLEVTKDNYHRWVRYIHIRRDQESSVNVDLDEKLPEEIR